MYPQCTNVRVTVCLCVYFARTHYMHACTCVYVCLHARLYVQACVYFSFNLFIRLPIHPHIYACVMYIYMNMHLHEFVGTHVHKFVGTACACQPYFAKWQEDLYYETSLRRIAMHIYFRTQTSLLRRILRLLRHRFPLWCTRALSLALLFSRLRKRALCRSVYSNSVYVCVRDVCLYACLWMIHMCACARHGIVGV